jgi:hypothetical protein
VIFLEATRGVIELPAEIVSPSSSCLFENATAISVVSDLVDCCP